MSQIGSRIEDVEMRKVERVVVDNAGECVPSPYFHCHKCSCWGKITNVQMQICSIVAAAINLNYTVVNPLRKEI